MNEIEEVFSYWKQVMQKGRAMIDSKREKAIRARLRDGYSVQDIKDAIQGCAWSKFHCGENDRQKRYQDIELICRDACHVDSFIDIFEREQKKRAHVEVFRELGRQAPKANPQGMAQLRAIIGGRSA